MQLIARKSLTYGGARIRAGQSFEATRKDGKVLVAIGKASDGPSGIVQLASLTVELPEQQWLSPEEVRQIENIPPDQEPQPKTKRTYKRRDLTSES